MHFAVNIAFEHQTSQQVCQALALARINCCFYVKLVKTHNCVVH